MTNLSQELVNHTDQYFDEMKKFQSLQKENALQAVNTAQSLRQSFFKQVDTFQQTKNSHSVKVVENLIDKTNLLQQVSYLCFFHLF